MNRLFPSVLTRYFSIATMALSLAIIACPTHAAYPERSITLIVPFPAGGRTDLTARLVADFLREELGQTVVVTNKGGAGGVIGAKDVAKAPTDGYTLGFFSTGFLTTQYTVATPTNVKEYELISLINFDPAAVAASRASGFKNLGEVAAAAKAKPLALNVGINTGSSAHIFAASFFDTIGAAATFIAFKGGSERSVALSGGHIDLDFDIVAAMRAADESGMIRILGIAAENRNELYPEIPTMKEQGVDLVIASWHGLFAPKGTPQAVVEKVARALENVSKKPAFLEKMRAQMLGVRYMGPKEFEHFYAEQDKHFKAVIDKLGLNVQRSAQ